MRTFAAALAIVLLAMPAYGQGRGRHHSSDQKTAQHKPKTDDKDYNRALSSLPDQKYDPWGGMR